MKKIYTTLVLLFAMAFVNAQVVSIPDINFKAKLLSASPTNEIAKDLAGNWVKIDTNNDNLIQQSEANNISEIIINSSTGYNNCYDNINSLVNFINLKRLELKNNYCDNQLLSINLSNSPSLEEIDFYYSLGYNNTRNLNLSNCPNLKNIIIKGITNLDYTNSNNIKKLEWSSYPHTSFNGLNLNNLEELNISNSYYLNQINILNCTSLRKIDVSHNKLEILNLTGLTQLEELHCGFQAFIGQLWQEGCGVCSAFIRTLDDLNLSGCNALKYLYLEENTFVNGLDLSNFVNLEIVDLGYHDSFYNSVDGVGSNGIMGNLNFQGCINLKEINLNRIPTSQNFDFSNFTNLEKLYCNLNNFNSLNLNNCYNLKELECSWCPNLNSLNINNCFNFEKIICNNSSLVNLNMNNNDNLNVVQCYNNQLTNINLSNCPSLQTLQCQNNQLTTLDLSSCGNLQSVNCDNNNLEYISFKNNTNETKTFLNNPDLTYVCADDAEQWDVQLIINLYEMYDTCNVGDYCSFNPNGNFNTISGNALYDNENDGCDSNDEVFEFLRVNLTDGTNSGSTFTNFEGDYSFFMDEGNFTLIPQLENPTYFNVSPATANFSFTDNLNNTASQNFCITPNGIHNDVEVVLAQVTPARPGFDAEYSLVYKNKGNQTEDAYIVINFDDTILDFVSTSLSPTNSIPGTIHWLVPSLLPFENGVITIVFHVNAPTDTPSVNIGDILHFYTTIDIVSVDEHPADNGFNFNQTVVGSYDPNDIYCLEGDVVDPTLIGQYLHYNVRFENTGTAAAENIVVATTINPAEYDLNTLQVLNASHNVYTRIKNNKVEFIFENIQLAGSPSGGHGNILFKMKSKNNLQTNDDVTSNANIFFDYNFPVETNDATTVFETLSNQDFTKDTSVKVFPNPAKETVTISAKNIINSITIYDAQGRIVQFIKANELEKTIDVSILSNGIYILDIVSEKGRMVEKLVKK